MRIISRLVVICWSCFLMGAIADNARFYVQVHDSVTDEPVSNISVLGTFTSKYPRWEKATEYSDFSAVTGKDGKLFFSGTTNCGRAGFRTEKTPTYYGSPWIRISYERKKQFPFTWWQPDNLVVTVRLQRVENPTPLFVKKATLKNLKDGIGGFDGTNSVVRFDLMKGDWLPPYGKGEVADVEFRSTVKITDKERKFRYATRRVEDVLFYDLGTVISMCSKKDALSTFAIEKNAGIKIRKAQENLVSSEIVNNRGMRKIINPKFKNEWHCEYYSNFKESNCYQFRIRSKYDEKGDLKEAYYGKIYGDFEIEGDDKKGLIGIAFLYYLNPNPLGRNLEWDMKNNLCPNPGSLSQPMP